MIESQKMSDVKTASSTPLRAEEDGNSKNIDQQAMPQLI